MSMNVGSNRGLSAEINITPMIDVLLVLIIIFMMITPWAPTGEPADIPQPPTGQTPPPDIINTTVVLQLIAAPDGPPTLKINDNQIAWNDLSSRLHTIFDPRKERVMFVKADADLDWDNVAQAIDIAHHAGVANIGLLTRGNQRQ